MAPAWRLFGDLIGTRLARVWHPIGTCRAPVWHVLFWTVFGAGGDVTNGFREKFCGGGRGWRDFARVNRVKTRAIGRFWPHQTLRPVRARLPPQPMTSSVWRWSSMVVSTPWIYAVSTLNHFSFSHRGTSACSSHDDGAAFRSSLRRSALRDPNMAIRVFDAPCDHFFKLLTAPLGRP